MSDDNDHRIKRAEEDLQADDGVYKLVKIGASAEYESPGYKDSQDGKSTSKIYCNCHTVCGCDSVDNSNCGCHDVCSCDNVCTCNSHTTTTSYCTCNTVEYCTCNAVCTCNSHCSCNSQHYWHPN
ncbi:MAG: solute carrier organic anion transporter [Desulfobulbaceae bacterium]|nr:solute carrier organic anion transporter [Desulfobulbaceae bacterium]